MPPSATPQNLLFLVPVKVRRGPSSQMPAHFGGAFVECFVGAPDQLSAVKRAVAELQSRGDIFEDLVGGQVHQLDLASWPGYLERKYPELKGHLPVQPDAAQLLRSGGVFFGPFAGWEREA